MKPFIRAKTIAVVIILLLYSATTELKAQPDRVYSTSGWEFIFSGAKINNQGVEGGVRMRFTIVVNIQNYLNIDISDRLGFFTGFAVRNVGFIYEHPDSTNLKKKYRTYNLGIPVGFKIGNLKKLF